MAGKQMPSGTFERRAETRAAVAGATAQARSRQGVLGKARRLAASVAQHAGQVRESDGSLPLGRSARGRGRETDQPQDQRKRDHARAQAERADRGRHGDASGFAHGSQGSGRRSREVVSGIRPAVAG